MLSDTDRTRIAGAIAKAESTTSAEIVVLVAARAGLYRSAALVPALALGLAVPWPLILFHAVECGVDRPDAGRHRPRGSGRSLPSANPSRPRSPLDPAGAGP